MKWICLAAGGVAGPFARYLVGGAVQRSAGPDFPYGTLAVNLLGCLIIGFLASFCEKKFFLSPEARLFLFTGFLGAFTTFSALICESWLLIRAGQGQLAGANLLGSLVLGLLAFWLGHLVAVNLA